MGTYMYADLVFMCLDATGSSAAECPKAKLALGAGAIADMIVHARKSQPMEGYWLRSSLES